jgi:hypothetical protein
MWNDNVVQKCTKLSPTSWKLAFDDGTVGEFHLPPQTDNYVVDIELQPQVIWGGSVSKTSSDDILKKLSTRYSKGTGGIRFDWNELNIDRDTSSKLAAEQLGEGRAKLQRSSASARSALIEATHKYGLAIIDHVYQIKVLNWLMQLLVLLKLQILDINLLLKVFMSHII